MLQQTVAALRRWFSRDTALEAYTDMDVDRRLDVRRLTDRETTYRPADGGDSPPLTARVRNISRGGVRLLLRQAVDSGTLLSIDFPAVEDRPAYTMLATVLHVTAHGEGEWAAGCAFACQLSEADVQAFVTQRPPPEHPDLRAHPRIPYPTTTDYRIVSEIEQDGEQARILDISPSGIGLVLTRPLEVGTLLTLKLSGVLNILASVARADAETNGEWKVGCTFNRELSDRELQTLIE
jgi:c-di-GMP-binding flagellar brake protein YcgR